MQQNKPDYDIVRHFNLCDKKEIAMYQKLLGQTDDVSIKIRSDNKKVFYVDMKTFAVFLKYYFKDHTPFYKEMIDNLVLAEESLIVYNRDGYIRDLIQARDRLAALIDNNYEDIVIRVDASVKELPRNYVDERIDNYFLLKLENNSIITLKEDTAKRERVEVNIINLFNNLVPSIKSEFFSNKETAFIVSNSTVKKYLTKLENIIAESTSFRVADVIRIINSTYVTKRGYKNNLKALLEDQKKEVTKLDDLDERLIQFSDFEAKISRDADQILDRIKIDLDRFPPYREKLFMPVILTIPEEFSGNLRGVRIYKEKTAEKNNGFLYFLKFNTVGDVEKVTTQLRLRLKKQFISDVMDYLIQNNPKLQDIFDRSKSFYQRSLLKLARFLKIKHDV
jgi:hypothetical protein